MRRYWFEFVDAPMYSPLRLGCGVSAFDRGDAQKILREKVFAEVGSTLEIRRVIEDVDVSTLDPGHVRPNMGVVVHRGVWFPLGYDR